MKPNRSLLLLPSVILGTLLIVGMVSAASTIGTDISTDGSLIVTGTAGLGSTTVTNLISSNTSTSTFAGGIDVSTGCFSINGSCVSGGGGGVSSFNSRTGVVVPVAGDYTSQMLGDFLVTQTSATQLSVAPSKFVPTTATINVAPGAGIGNFTIYYDDNDDSIHMYCFGGSPDLSKISGVNITVDPNNTEYFSDSFSMDIAEVHVGSNVFSSLSDIRRLGMRPQPDTSAGPGLVVLNPSISAGRYPGFISYSIDPNGPTGLWQKWNVTVNGANFDITAPDGTVTSVPIDAALTQDLNYALLPLRARIIDIAFNVPVHFALGGAVNITFGDDDDGSSYFIATPYNAEFANSAILPSDGKLDNYGLVGALAFQYSLNVGFNAANNLNTLVSGSLDIWVKYSVLP